MISANQPSGTISFADRPINERELASINAMVAFVAYQYKVDQEFVIGIIGDHFSVDEVSQLKYIHFDAAIRFLTDMEPKNYIN